METFKNTGIFKHGIFRWWPDCYGPVLINQIEAGDFIQVQTSLLETIDDLIYNIPQRYFEHVIDPLVRKTVFEKIVFSLRFVPLDKTIFFQYNIPVESTNNGSTKVLEHHPISYFHFFLGYNQEKLYLLTIFND